VDLEPGFFSGGCLNIFFRASFYTIATRHLFPQYTIAARITYL